MSTYAIRSLTQDDLALLMNVAEGVFDNSIEPTYAAEFLNDPRHHIVVAIADGHVIGFASAVHYIHPDKPPELWINEVGVAPSYHRQGIGKAIMEEMLRLGRELDCRNAWVLTDRGNEPANHLYRSVGGEADAGETIMYEFKIPNV